MNDRQLLSSAVIPNAKVHKNVRAAGKRETKEARDRKGRDNKDSGRDEGSGREGTSQSLEKSCYPYVA